MEIRCKKLYFSRYFSLKMPVKPVTSTDSSDFISLMLFSRSSNYLLKPIRQHFLRNRIHYSASAFRLVLLLRLSGGSSVAQLQAWLGRSSMPQCYVKVSEKLICRYGRGKGKLACYRLTCAGNELADHCLVVFRELVSQELRQLPKKARETKVARAKKSKIDAD